MDIVVAKLTRVRDLRNNPRPPLLSGAQIQNHAANPTDNPGLEISPDASGGGRDVEDDAVGFEGPRFRVRWTTCSWGSRDRV